MSAAAVMLLGATSAVALVVTVVAVLAARRTGERNLWLVAAAFALISLRSVLLFAASWSRSLQESLLDWRLGLLELTALVLLATTLARR